jgi:predicted enzyme related to lactoylglutathione lyase
MSFRDSPGPHHTDPHNGGTVTRAKGKIMGQPVVHFEIIGKDPERLRSYYSRLFGWEFETPSPVASEVSDPDSYGFVDLLTTEDGTGIRGGIGGGAGHDNHAVFYVGVPDVQAALDQAEQLGGTRVMGPHQTGWLWPISPILKGVWSAWQELDDSIAEDVPRSRSATARSGSSLSPWAARLGLNDIRAPAAAR